MVAIHCFGQEFELLKAGGTFIKPRTTYLLSIYSLDSLGVGDDLAIGVIFKQLHPLVPLKHIVRVLS